jgi:hypothetical protein
MSWTAIETTTIAELEQSGFTATNARVLTAMVSRRYARERSKLLDVLSAHTGLERQASVDECLTSLARQGLIATVIYDGNPLVGIAQDLGPKLVDINQRAATALVGLVARPISRFGTLGPMTDPAVLGSFGRAIADAHGTIRMVFLTSDTNIEGIHELEARARAGVDIRILVGDPDTVAAIRGGSSKARAQRAIESWVSLTRPWPNTQVRIAKDAADLDCPSSFSRDGELLRLDVHEPLSERSLMGEMLVAHPAGGNLIRLYERHFDAAWERARSTRRVQRLSRVIAGFRWALATAATAVVTFSMGEGAPREVAAGILAATALAAVDESGARFVRLWRRVRDRG